MTFKRVDKNQKEVVQQLRELGFTVGLTHMVGSGFPDFVVGFLNYNLLIELKSENGKLTEHEIKFIDEYNGYVSVCFSTLDIIDSFIEYLYLLNGFKENYCIIKLKEIYKCPIILQKIK